MHHSRIAFFSLACVIALYIPLANRPGVGSLAGGWRVSKTKTRSGAPSLGRVTWQWCSLCYLCSLISENGYNFIEIYWNPSAYSW
jgi:hypothetical protein